MASAVDLHMHSRFSDGTDSPSELVERVAEAGITVFALTDHDTVSGVEAAEKLVPEGAVFIPGIEFSCRAESGDCHILGYGCDMEAPSFREALDVGRRLRAEKLERRIEFLKTRGICLPERELEALRAMPVAGKPHLANLLVGYGFAANRDRAIRDILDMCHTGSSRIPAEAAVSAILSSGGIPVWAHPLGGEGDPEAGPERFSATLSELISYGLAGLECFYSRYTPEKCEALSRAAETRGLFVSGGSDYHGGNKNIAPGTLNSGGAAVDPSRLTILTARDWRTR